jgi:hypothetical protein
MFEQEIEMEQRQSSVVPLLLIVAMILTIVGVAGYYLIENRKVLASADAGKLVAGELKSGAIHDSFPGRDRDRERRGATA